MNKELTSTETEGGGQSVRTKVLLTDKQLATLVDDGPVVCSFCNSTRVYLAIRPRMMQGCKEIQTIFSCTDYGASFRIEYVLNCVLAVREGTKEDNDDNA